MSTLRGSDWGPRALPEFLRAQLDAHGFGVDDAGRAARMINEQPGAAASASLFVDLGSCKFLEADIDGAIAAWRHALSTEHHAAASRAMLNLGLLYEHLQLTDHAIALLAGVAERNVSPYVSDAAMASARIQLDNGDAEQAMETMARLAQHTMARKPDGPELIEALFSLGDVAESAGRLDRAERSWRVAAASPTSRFQQLASDRLVRLLLRRGQPHAVLELRQSSGGVLPPAIALDLADSLFNEGSLPLAQQVLEGIDGANCGPAQRFRLADGYRTCGLVNQAIDEYEALLVDDDVQVHRRALVSLGQVYTEYDMAETAELMFERVIATGDPYWTPVALLAYGDLHASNGALDAAAEAWTNAAASPVTDLAAMAQARLDRPVVEPEAVVVPSAPAEAEQAAPDVAPARSEFIADVLARTAPHDAMDPQVISLQPLDVPDQVDPAATVASQVSSPEPVGDDAADPLVVVLSSVDPAPISDVIETRGQWGEPSTEAALTFAGHLGDEQAPNPYASLAPERNHADVEPTNRNPYAELAPNYDDDFEPPVDVEPGDWQSMLEDWPITPSEPAPRQGSSAFSRHT